MAWQWLSHFVLKVLVSLVKRSRLIRMVRLFRPTSRRVYSDWHLQNLLNQSQGEERRELG